MAFAVGFSNLNIVPVNFYLCAEGENKLNTSAQHNLKRPEVGCQFIKQQTKHLARVFVRYYDVFSLLSTKHVFLLNRYNQMLQCWSRFSEMRPSFSDLTEKMNEFVQRSHDSNSVFAGVFVVSLPLPRSLPGERNIAFFSVGSACVYISNT